MKPDRYNGHTGILLISGRSVAGILCAKPAKIEPPIQKITAGMYMISVLKQLLTKNIYALMAEETFGRKDC